jgi:hypothetical protein
MNGAVHFSRRFGRQRLDDALQAGAEPDRGRVGSAALAHQIVIPAAAHQRALCSGFAVVHLEHGARVVIEATHQIRILGERDVQRAQQLAHAREMFRVVIDQVLRDDRQLTLELLAEFLGIEDAQRVFRVPLQRVRRQHGRALMNGGLQHVAVGRA